ncbi:MAG: hypothetical protein MJ087_03260 [Lachnospiraceae bacterium]|nr:hypothetical protein [Lachnospiraceae bacterium]
MELIIANGLVGLSHTFLLAQFMSLIVKSKYSQNKTALLFWVSIFTYSTGINYLTPAIPVIKFLVGIIGLSLATIFISKEKLFVKIGKGIIGHFTGVSLEICILFILLPFYFDNLVLTFELTPRLIMSRVIYGMFFYLFMVVVEMIYYHKKAPEYMPVFLVFLALGILEMGIFKCVVLLDSVGVSRHFVTLSGVSGISIILQYYLGLEILRSHIAKKEQDALMEEMQKEQDYHYESYQLANKQNEKLRDIRHDMNNYLQTILTLGEDEMTKEQAGSMIEELKGKVDTAFGS